MLSDVHGALTLSFDPVPGLRERLGAARGREQHAAAERQTACLGRKRHASRRLAATPDCGSHATGQERLRNRNDICVLAPGRTTGAGDIGLLSSGDRSTDRQIDSIDQTLDFSQWSNRSRDGPIRVEEARLYTLPEQAPLLIGAALTPSTAAWAGSWADGLITINQSRDKVKAIIDAFRAGGGEGKPLILQTRLAFAETEGEARHHAFDQWRSNAFASTIPNGCARRCCLPPSAARSDRASRHCAVCHRAQSHPVCRHRPAPPCRPPEA